MKRKGELILLFPYYDDQDKCDLVALFEDFTFEYYDGFEINYSKAIVNVESTALGQNVLYIKFNVIYQYDCKDIWGRNNEEFFDILSPNVARMLFSGWIAYPRCEWGNAKFTLRMRNYVRHSFIFEDSCENLFDKTDYNKWLSNDITLIDVLNWIRGIRGDDCKIVYNALSYIQNRDYCEKLFYAVRALERIYVKDCMYQQRKHLKERVPTVLPFVSEEKIDSIYKCRSAIVHGDIKLGNLFDDSKYETERPIRDDSVAAIEILILTVREMVRRNVYKFTFDR